MQTVEFLCFPGSAATQNVEVGEVVGFADRHAAIDAGAGNQGDGDGEVIFEVLEIGIGEGAQALFAGEGFLTQALGLLGITGGNDGIELLLRQVGSTIDLALSGNVLTIG